MSRLIGWTLWWAALGALVAGILTGQPWCGYCALERALLVPVDHNWCATDELRLVLPGGTPVAGAQVRVWPAERYGGRTDARDVVGQTETDAAGRWQAPVYVPDGGEYVIEYRASGRIGVVTTQMTVRLTPTATVTPTPTPTGQAGPQMPGADYDFAYWTAEDRLYYHPHYSARTAVWMYVPGDQVWYPREICRAEVVSGGPEPVAFGRLLLMGGVAGYWPTETLTEDSWSYLEETGWTARDTLPRKDAYSGRVFCPDGRVHWFGGRSTLSGYAWQPGKTHYIYDPLNDEYSSGPDLPEARGGHAAVLVGNKVYLIGGSGNSGAHSFGRVYDLETQTYSLMAAPPSGTIAEHRCVAWGHYIYLFGGYGATLEPAVYQVARYDTTTNTWALVGELPQGRYGHAVAAVGDVIYVWGGYSTVYGEAGAKNTLWQYFPDEDRWHEEPTQTATPTRTHTPNMTETYAPTSTPMPTDLPTPIVAHMRWPSGEHGTDLAIWDDGGENYWTGLVKWPDEGALGQVAATECVIAATAWVYFPDNGGDWMSWWLEPALKAWDAEVVNCTDYAAGQPWAWECGWDDADFDWDLGTPSGEILPGAGAGWRWVNATKPVRAWVGLSQSIPNYGAALQPSGYAGMEAMYLWRSGVDPYDRAPWLEIKVGTPTPTPGG